MKIAGFPKSNNPDQSRISSSPKSPTPPRLIKPAWLADGMDGCSSSHRSFGPLGCCAVLPGRMCAALLLETADGWQCSEPGRFHARNECGAYVLVYVLRSTFYVLQSAVPMTHSGMGRGCMQGQTRTDACEHVLAKCGWVIWGAGAAASTGSVGQSVSYSFCLYPTHLLRQTACLLFGLLQTV